MSAARCELCGERFGPSDDRAEMAILDEGNDTPAVICHPECGLARGYDIA